MRGRFRGRVSTSPVDQALQRHLGMARRALQEAMLLCSRTATLRREDDASVQFVGGPRAREALSLIRRAVREVEGVGQLMTLAPDVAKETRQRTRAVPLAILTPDDEGED